jgi:hypothetical protein
VERYLSFSSLDLGPLAPENSNLIVDEMDVESSYVCRPVDDDGSPYIRSLTEQSTGEPGASERIPNVSSSAQSEIFLTSKADYERRIC